MSSALTTTWTFLPGQVIDTLEKTIEAILICHNNVPLKSQKSTIWVTWIDVGPYGPFVLEF